ncbi:AraC-like DNA-binding protein [Bradyrhizobium sp. S3.3.6]
MCPEHHPVSISDRTGLTDADWLQVNKLRKAYATGGRSALSEALEDFCSQNVTSYIRVLNSILPNKIRETIKADIGTSTGRYRDMITRLDLIVQDLPSLHCYSNDLARRLGTSVRTLQVASRRVNGMSLHAYLRLKRLLAVRDQLSTGLLTVKAAALGNGFWHLGDFSRLYAKTFGEMPSETLARAKRVTQP